MKRSQNLAKIVGSPMWWSIRRVVNWIKLMEVRMVRKGERDTGADLRPWFPNCAVKGEWKEGWIWCWAPMCFPFSKTQKQAYNGTWKMWSRAWWVWGAHGMLCKLGRANAVLEPSMCPGYSNKGLDKVTPMECPPWGKKQQGADAIPRETPTFKG